MSARIPIRIRIEEFGELEGELIRFYAPLTVRELLGMLPISGAVALWDYAIYFQIPLSRGTEKPIRRVKPGDILYWPPGGCIVLAFAEADPPAQATKIGEFRGDYGKLRSIRPGARISISRL